VLLGSEQLLRPLHPLRCHRPRGSVVTYYEWTTAHRHGGAGLYHITVRAEREVMGATWVKE